jgi:hypothetical protein
MLKSTAKLKLIDNLIVYPDKWIVYGDLYRLTWLQSGNLWIEAAMDCLRAVSDGMISVECRHTNFNSCKQN